MLGFNAISEDAISSLATSVEEAAGSELEIACAFTAPLTSVTAGYFVNVPRPLVSGRGLGWQGAGKTARPDKSLGWDEAAKARKLHVANWEESSQLVKEVSEVTEFPERAHTLIELPYEQGSRVDSQLIKILAEIWTRTRASRSSRWEEAIRGLKTFEDSWKVLDRAKRGFGLPWETASRVTIGRRMAASVATPTPINRRIPWQEGQRPGWSPPANPPDPPVVTPYTPSTVINFECPWIAMPPLEVALNFSLLACHLTVTIPTRKVYLIVNELTLTRVSDGANIAIKSARIGTDSDSWAWTFSGEIDYRDFEKVEPSSDGPVEVELTINGVVWRLLVEDYDSTRAFVTQTVSISGRSVTAFLSDPYAPMRSWVQDEDLASVQIATQELDNPGLVTGFSYDWQLVDSIGWLMPTGSFAFTNKTPIQVAQDIARGGGGYLLSSPASKVIKVLPLYQMGPWDWAGATPDKIVPSSIIKGRRLRWTEKPSYNGVYISGETTGVLALVRRDGTLGDYLAPMVVNPMITTEAVARQRGLQALGEGGRQAEVELSFPMLTELGLLQPGNFLQVTGDGNWKGVVRGVSIQAQWGKGLTVQQTATIERHYY